MNQYRCAECGHLRSSHVRLWPGSAAQGEAGECRRLDCLCTEYEPQPGGMGTPQPARVGGAEA